MSCNLFCAQCNRKNPKETSVFNSFCVCCNETLCLECSKNHTAVKGFSNHELILSDSFSSHNFASSHAHCNVHRNMIPTWYCLTYHIYLCYECENKVRHIGVSCNNHVCFRDDLSNFILANIKTHVGSELEKMEKTLEICYTSRIVNEEDLNTQISEKSLENVDNKRKIFDECLNQLKSERKGIEKLQQYLQSCQEELKLHFRSENSRMLSFLMRMSNLKQDIIALYSSLNKISLQRKDCIETGRLERNLSPIYEARNSIIKSFQIECALCLQEEYVKKIILIENYVVVFTGSEIQRYNARYKLENKITVSYFDSAYITKYRLVAILVDELNDFSIQFLKLDSFLFEGKRLTLERPPSLQSISIIDATSEYVYFAGHNYAGRVNFDGKVDCVSFIGEVGNSMHISKNNIFIPCRHCVKIYSLKFESLRTLTLAGETPALGTEFKGQYQQYGIYQGIPNNQTHPFNNNSTMACNFISITTDHANNVYAATDSQGIIRWNCPNKQWEPVLTGCHGVRNPSFLCFDNEFANLCVCSNEFSSYTKHAKWLLKYNVILDI